MIDTRVRIRLLSPLGTPWQADTLFGHLAWQVALGRADLSIDEFLAPFRSGDPPFILSDGFPAGLLPRPIFPPGHDPAARPRPATLAEAIAAKKGRRAPWVRVADFELLRAGRAPAGDPLSDPWHEVTRAHASLDRRTLRTGGEGSSGQFFETSQLVLEHDAGPALDLYLRAVDETWRDRALALLRDLALQGYGRDKSTGLGQFDIAAVEPLDLDWSADANTNAVVLLSSTLPAATDPVDGAWRLRVKRGRIGEHVAGANPFKAPLLMLEPGAVLRLPSGAAPRPWYGAVAEGIAPGFPQAIHSGYGYAVPCRIPPAGSGNP